MKFQYAILGIIVSTVSALGFASENGSATGVISPQQLTCVKTLQRGADLVDIRAMAGDSLTVYFGESASRGYCTLPLAVSGGSIVPGNTIECTSAINRGLNTVGVTVAAHARSWTLKWNNEGVDNTLTLGLLNGYPVLAQEWLADVEGVVSNPPTVPYRESSMPANCQVPGGY